MGILRTTKLKGFDPITYKFIVKAGYNPKENLTLGKLTLVASDEHEHGLTTTQKMLKESKHTVQKTQTSCGFIPQNPVCIAIKRANIKYTTEDEFSSTNDDFTMTLVKNDGCLYLIG